MMQPERSAQSFGYKYRQNSFTYDVKRDVYNEETFQQEHRRKSISSGNLDIDITTFRHHVQCRCSWHKFLRCILTIFPFLEWVCLYRFKDWLIGDLLAGISVGCVQVPQGSFFLVSALMINVLRLYPFNSGHLVLGTFIKEDFSAPSFLVDYNRSLSVVASTTFLTGIIQLSMGLLGFGFLATYLPEAAISAYLAAVALHVILSQLTCIFGIMIGFHSGPISFFYNIVNYCATLPKANSTSILLFLTAVVALRINKCIRISFNRYPIEFPMEVLLILGFAAFANKITMATETSKMLIDMIPYSFLFPVTPDLNILHELILEAFSLALVSSSLLIFLGKKIASYHNYHVNSNQDLIAIGLCNVVSSFFRSCVFTGAIVRTIIQDKSGGRQQFASLVGAGVMLLLMVKVGRFFNELPNAVLAGIILSNILPYLEIIYNLPSLWRQNQYDCIIWLVTFTSAIFLGLDVGLLVSIAFAFFIITVRSHRTKILLLGQIPNTNIYRSFNDYREVTNLPGLKIFQCCNSITFVNVDHLKHKLLKEVEMVRVPLKEEEMFRLFNQSEEGSQEERICQCFCNCDELEPPPRMCNAFKNANILVLISGCHSSVVRAFERNDFFDTGITKAQLFLTLHDAVLFALSRKFPESSELSMDESETVIQETFSETDKNEESEHKMSSGLLEVSKNINPDYTMMQRPITEEDLELDLELEPTLESEQETGLDLDLDLDHEMEPESELELEPEPELEPRLEMEPESESMPRPRAQTFPRQQYWPLYQSMPPGSPSQARPRTQSLERRHQGLNSYSPKGNNT
ncbi:testis anion transporter 1 isoform X5 [Vulpes lagopus]|uniref:testis anion transporter 1 isoform X5 n=1 Tax=Vulpes lagopus TaxID=494514 RepID=UPI001BC9571C|nr:testis anion transporter 1 isoform X5 [Vulpes lagopus]